jgi:hypothetical protein
MYYISSFEASFTILVNVAGVKFCRSYTGMTDVAHQEPRFSFRYFSNQDSD